MRFLYESYPLRQARYYPPDAVGLTRGSNKKLTAPFRNGFSLFIILMSFAKALLFDMLTVKFYQIFLLSSPSGTLE